MNIERVKYIGIEFDFGEEENPVTRATATLEVEKDGVKSEVRHNIDLNRLDFTDHFDLDDSFSAKQPASGKLAIGKTNAREYQNDFAELVKEKVARDLIG